LRRTFPRPPRSLGSLIAGFKPPAHHRCEPSLGPRIFGFGSGTTMNDGSVMPPPWTGSAGTFLQTRHAGFIPPRLTMRQNRHR
jgi:hypothetical protein